jgi:hypothetical protein
MQSLDIPYTSQNRQAIRVTRQIANRHSILRTQIHAGNIEHLKHLLGMLLILALHRLAQLRQRTQVRVRRMTLPLKARSSFERSFDYRR